MREHLEVEGTRLANPKPMRRGHGVQTTLQRTLERENVANRGKLENMANRGHSTTVERENT